MPIILIVILCILICLIAVIAVRTARFKGVKTGQAKAKELPPDNLCAQKLAEAVKIRTISNTDYTKTDWAAFEEYHKLMERLFPLVHEKCEKTVINGYSLVYHLRAPNAQGNKKPLLITAHMDVVPVEPGTEGDWGHEAFSGDIEDGVVWGRGTLDTKIHMIAALEALERLLKEGYEPPRDIWMAFGHDEEVEGRQGAAKIVEYFAEQGLEFDFILDEGGCVTENVLEGVDKPIALIGVGEKGFADIRFTASGAGGHASTPPKHSAVGILAEALCRVENHQSKTRLIKPVREFLLNIGPEMGLVNRVILANLWLFKPLFTSIFAKTGYGGAMLRTTTAVTMASGSPASNVLPQKATAVANFRILPGETGQELLDRLKKLLRGLPVTVEPLILNNPSLLSPSDSEGFRLIEKTTRLFYPNAVITPYLVMAATDARKYEGVCKNIYRFSPYKIDNDELKKMHGTDENITVENVGRCTAFFRELFENC